MEGYEASRSQLLEAALLPIFVTQSISDFIAVMKVILDIKETSRIPFFMELVKSLDYIKVVKEVKDKSKSAFVADLADAFNDVKLYEQGKKKLKSAKELLSEL
jgi:hypothetical protein